MELALLLYITLYGGFERSKLYARFIRNSYLSEIQLNTCLTSFFILRQKQILKFFFKWTSVLNSIYKTSWEL
jgi:hypothetical protein